MNIDIVREFKPLISPFSLTLSYTTDESFSSKFDSIALDDFPESILGLNICKYGEHRMFDTCSRGGYNKVVVTRDDENDIYFINFKYNVKNELTKYRWVECDLNISNQEELPSTKLVVSVTGAPNVYFRGYLANIILTTNANYLFMGDHFVQENVTIHAPHLKGLKINVNAAEAMKLTPETKPEKIVTDGELNKFLSFDDYYTSCL